MGEPLIGHKKSPVHIGTGLSIFPRYHPINPIARTSLAGHYHAPSLLTGDDPDPVYSPCYGFRLAAPEGFSVRLAHLLSLNQAR